ncbi:hypothetical protein [Pantoea sp.]|uniref:hypothetical protein n=1 Tax=Pantoea sp. TaxID=69393 RepID=UPI0028B19BA5|nr:hypothetical protein [Pantoea sp.]
MGMTLAEYDAQRSDKNIDAALFPACHKMDTAMKSQGRLNRITLTTNDKLIVNPYCYELNYASIKVLAAYLVTHTKYPDGISSASIVWSLKKDWRIVGNNSIS